MDLPPFPVVRVVSAEDWFSRTVLNGNLLSLFLFNRLIYLVAVVMRGRRLSISGSK